MKKKSPLFLLFVLSMIMSISSCKEDGISYKERLEMQEENINRFIRNRGLQILNNFPNDSIFAENQFYKDPSSGVYFCVHSLGNKNTIATKEPLTQVLMRPESFCYLSDTSQIKYPYAYQPLSIIYGKKSTYIYQGQNTNGNPDAELLSPALVAPLSYVGEGAIVSFIIPFQNGSKTQSTYYEALYLKKMEYTKFLRN